MTEDIRTALTILERAMSIEDGGQQFYREAAQTTQDINGQEMFGTLAGDEQKHYDLIRRQHVALSDKGKWVGSADIKAVEIDLEKQLFPKGIEALKKTITVKSDDWDALMFGLDIEIKSYDLYRNAASQIEDSLGKQMFQFLAGQEQSHWDILMMRYEYFFGPVSWQY